MPIRCKIKNKMKNSMAAASKAKPAYAVLKGSEL